MYTYIGVLPTTATQLHFSERWSFCRQSHSLHCCAEWSWSIPLRVAKSGAR